MNTWISIATFIALFGVIISVFSRLNLKQYLNKSSDQLLTEEISVTIMKKCKLITISTLIVSISSVIIIILRALSA